MQRIRRVLPLAAVVVLAAALSGCTGAGAQSLPSVQVEVGQGQGDQDSEVSSNVEVVTRDTVEGIP